MGFEPTLHQAIVHRHRKYQMLRCTPSPGSSRRLTFMMNRTHRSRTSIGNNKCISRRPLVTTIVFVKAHRKIKSIHTVGRQGRVCVAQAASISAIPLPSTNPMTSSMCVSCNT